MKKNIIDEDMVNTNKFSFEIESSFIFISWIKQIKNAIYLSCVITDFELIKVWCISGEQWTESRRRYSCEDCGRAYINIASLGRHKRFECGKHPQFFCSLCPYKSKHKNNLKRHVRMIHNYVQDKIIIWLIVFDRIFW